MVKVRSKTVEPVLGTLINFTNMKRVNTRGIQQANKHVLMTALTYNLKNCLKFIVKKLTIQIHVIVLIQEKVRACLKTCLKDLKTEFLRECASLNSGFTVKINLA